LKINTCPSSSSVSLEKTPEIKEAIIRIKKGETIAKDECSIL
jgi:hypothetical protein